MLLLHQWKAKDALDADPVLRGATLDFTDKRNLMLRVAHAMQTSERGLAGNLIDEDTLKCSLTEGLKGMPNLRADRAARALIEQLRGRNFMLCSVGGLYYAFVHRTFLEYFCGLEIRERFETDQTLTIDQLKMEIFAHWAPLLRPKLSQLQFSSNAPGRQPAKNSSSFLRSRSATCTHGPPITGQSNSFFPGVNEPGIRSSKTLSP